MSDSTVAAGDRSADSASLNASEPEDMMAEESSQRDNEELASDSITDSTWIDVVKRAQRRRQRKAAHEVAVTTSTAAPSQQPLRRSAPKPSPFPRDDYKLVLRPQGGLKIADVDWAEISLGLLNSVNFTWRQANLKVRFDAKQNTATISTPFENAAKALNQVKQIKLGNVSHPVQVYGLAPDDSAKGLNRGVPLPFSEAEL
ncbi:hypothetical protein HPB48_020409 [Haemaphysalis longicornis]|uniref:Uncharacterized protein n=1 Tax=Haemaphysalis longicornis TaxID=44386 RepID=A0A9J6GQU1_HAELO|nr:hypothetical protein HPB48_020409 [Haemaphysalis longicornis]